MPELSGYPSPAPFTGNETFVLDQAGLTRTGTLSQVAAYVTQTLTGSPVSYASAAGVQNNVSPPGFTAAVHRLSVTLPSGNATWTGLAAGTDGQDLILWNADATKTLILAVNNSGSSGSNRFAGSGNLSLFPGNAVRLSYWGGTVNQWVIVP